MDLICLLFITLHLRKILQWITPYFNSFYQQLDSSFIVNLGHFENYRTISYVALNFWQIIICTGTCIKLLILRFSMRYTSYNNLKKDINLECTMRIHKVYRYWLLFQTTRLVCVSGIRNKINTPFNCKPAFSMPNKPRK